MAYNSKVSSQTTTRFTQGQTRTYEDIGKFLGNKPHRFGLVSSMHKDLTCSFLTEALGNVFTNEKKAGRFQEIDAMSFEWDNDLNFIKTVEFAAVPTAPAAGEDIIMAFKDNYYDKYDSFVIDESRQICIVLSQPDRKADDYWEYTVQLIDPDLSEVLDVDACQVGMSTRWRSTHHPELSERGSSKSQSSTEKHRNYITLNRSDIYYSQQYAVLENTFLKIAKGNDSIYVKMNSAEKDCTESFMRARNEGMLWNKCNVDANGKPTTKDPMTNRPIYIGDGIVPQIERFADFTVFAKGALTIDDFYKAMGTMREKSDKDEGNHWIFMVNSRMWDYIQKVILEHIKDFKTDGAFFYSKKAGYTQVGATFQTFEHAGNLITFKIDRSLSKEFRNQAYGVMIDLTPDETTNKPALSMITLKGSEHITGNIRGLGGRSGSESGDIVNAIAGSGYIVMGYAGVMVAAPYRSHIFFENVV